MAKMGLPVGKCSFAIAVSLLLQGFVHALPVYNAAADFATVSNPNGVWRYGYSHAGGASYSAILFDKSRNNAGVDKAWGSSTVSVLDTPLAWVNLRTVTAVGAAPGQLSLHPGPTANGDFTFLRFVAPKTASYSLASSFLGGDPLGDTDARVLFNADFLHPLASFASTASNVSFNTTLNLTAGDFLDFVVGNKGNFFNDNTPVSVVIAELAPSSVPEPGTLALFGLGLVGVAVRRRNRG